MDGETCLKHEQENEEKIMKKTFEQVVVDRFSRAFEVD